MKISINFDKFYEPGTYSRVSEDHVLDLFYGLDNQGHETLFLKSTIKPKKVTPTSMIDVVITYKNNHEWFLNFHLIDKEFRTVFSKFCEDLIFTSSGLDSPSLGPSFIIDRYNQWRKLFYKSNQILTENQILGLLGELVFMNEYMFEKYGFEKTIFSWTASDKLHKDFTLDKEWYEVKACLSNARSIRISSLEQLDSNLPGELVVICLEKMSAQFNGLLLNSLVNNMLATLPHDLSIYFLSELNKQGYEYNEIYDNFCYDLKIINRYVVDKKFPIIKRENLDDAITNVKYDLMLSMIDKFKI